MNQNVHIFMEYKVKSGKEQLYEQTMVDIAEAMSEYGVINFRWYQAADQPNLYVELFEIPALSHYHTLKEERGSKNHPVFRKLDETIEGGLEKIHCWAFYEKTSELGY
ncbi:hypothetical protein D7Z54_19455 [Salibacterium salarium]|uniref:Quinol monooxygenase YgiN n=1 Tax=Salibacterium salarium TaxID=284579 RepID=A0A428MZM7_9BACI|nr:hypothetical protein [Salibacterium salarium]RSL31624.1 hypothetical protein D7Z54_19455 [Salibacterium salarium]